MVEFDIGRFELQDAVRESPLDKIKRTYDQTSAAADNPGSFPEFHRVTTVLKRARYKILFQKNYLIVFKDLKKANSI